MYTKINKCTYKLIFRFFTVTLALKIIDVIVPRYAELKQQVELGCDFDVEHDKLYSVKWYKDDNEFYRFVPENEPTGQFFRQPGITLNVSIFIFFFFQLL